MFAVNKIKNQRKCLSLDTKNKCKCQKQVEKYSSKVSRVCIEFTKQNYKYLFLLKIYIKDIIAYIWGCSVLAKEDPCLVFGRFPKLSFFYGLVFSYSARHFLFFPLIKHYLLIASISDLHVAQSATCFLLSATRSRL